MVLDWTLIGAWSSAASVIIALITLGAVVLQVTLARRQLRLAEHELKAVREDLAFSREQSKRLNERANLSCFVDAPIPPALPGPVVGANSFLNLFVHNHGTRAARGATVQLALPSKLMLYRTPDPAFPWTNLNKAFRGFQGHDSNSYSLDEAHFITACYAGHDTLLCKLPLRLEEATTSLPPIYFRIMFDDGTTPPDDADFAELLIK